MTKWYIWKHRNDYRYGNIPIRNPYEMYKITIEKCHLELNTFLKSKYAKKSRDDFITITDFNEQLNLIVLINF